MKQMIENGIPPNKIVIGKPIAATGYANNGYVTPENLHDWGCQISEDPGFNGWKGGFMTWMYRKGSADVANFGKKVAQKC